MRCYNPAGYVIHVAETSLMQMCLAGLEAYTVVHKGNSGHKTRLETYGLLFGTESELPNGKTFYSVELLSIDTSAEMAHNFTVPNAKALELKRDVLTSFFPQHDFIGDFHTHPYSRKTTYTDVGRNKLYEFSPDDYAHIKANSKTWIGHNYRVGMVLTLALLKRRSSGIEWLDSSLMMFTLGNYRLWLKGYVAMLDEGGRTIEFAKDSDVTLHCPSLVGLGECTAFGKGVGRQHCNGTI